jgi:hypothetical protein
MVSHTVIVVAVLGVAWLAAEPARAAPAPVEPPVGKPTQADIQKGLDLVNADLQKRSAQQAAQVRAIDDPAVYRALAGCLCYAVIFRQYPVARLAPEPLKSGNVFVVKQDKVEPISDAKALEKFFTDNLRPVKDDAAARDAVEAWLRLSQELHQDGFFQFTIPDKELAVSKEKDGQQASGKAVVEPKGGNSGEIKATLTFDADGKLARADETAKLKAGVRPICQATKLLDADPVVRRMAEKDILVMGRLAKPYLDEQRAKASPELRKAIDRVWQRILDEGW